MTQSTSFAQMANNQSISLSSALRANTPPTKGQTTSRKFLTLSIFFLLSFFTTNAWGAEELVYTLTPADGTNNSYTGNCDVEIDDITWNLTGNSQMDPWRIGGKNLNKVDRALYSKTAIEKDISRIVISHGAASDITVNSVKLFVSTKENGTGTVISELTNSFTASSTMTFTRPDGKDWTDAYYKIVYNVTVSGNSNKFVEFNEAKFYAETTPAIPFIVTLMDDPENPLTQSTAGATITLPSRDGCAGYTFVGWTKTWVAPQSSWTTTAPTIIPAGSYTPSANENLYPVYTKTESGGSSIITFTPGIETGSTSVTKSGVTCTMSTMNNASYYQIYGNASGRFSVASGNITAISFTCTASGTSKYGPGNASADVGTYSYSGSTGSWSGSASSITISSTAQVRMATLSITCSGGSTTYYISVPDCVTETSIYLHPNFGSESATQITTEAPAYPVPACSFSRLGYTFANWNTKEDGTGISYNTGATINNLDGTDVNLYAQWTCGIPVFDIKIKEDNPVVFSGESIELTVVGSNIAADATYQWYKKNGENYDELTGQTANKLTIAEATANDAGNYKCVVTNGTCSAENDFTVKMYSLRGLIDWSTDCSFTKVNATTATYSMELAANSSYPFKVYDGSAFYGNTGGDTPTMTSDNCTNWTMQENTGNNVTLQTTAAGTYTFTLDYTDASNPTISVTYPQKKMVYFNPDMWDLDGTAEVYTVYSWQEGSNGSFVTMTSVEGCGNTNIYQAEIDASHNKLLFIRWNQAHTAWDNNRWNQSIDLDYQTNGQYKIDDWGNNSDLYWKNGEKKSWASCEKTFTPNYTVTFDENGHGTAPDAQCLAKNGKATTPAAPTATGYTFGGWYKEAGCTNAWDFANDVVTADITLYAKWTINTHTVTWKPAGGNWSGNASDIVQTYQYGAAIEAPDKPTYDCHEFVEWNPTYNAEMTMPDEDLEFTAVWNKLSYTITFKNYDGTVLQTSTVECGETPSYTGATPTREQTAQYTYTFKGWSPTIAPATQDQVYTAQFNQTTRPYTVIWYDGTGNAHKTQTADYNTTVALPTTNPDPCDDEYPHFIGWTADPITGSTTTQPELVENVTVTGDCDYYAVFAKGEGGSSNYQKVTSALDDWSGEYLIVNETGNVAFNGGSNTLDANNNVIEVTISDNVIEASDETNSAKFTIAPYSTGYSIQSNSGKYIGLTYYENELEESADTKYVNTISFSNSTVSIKGTGNSSGTYVALKYNSSANRFRYYKSGQSDIALYKKGSGVNYTSFITTCCTSWTAPTLTYTTPLEENGTATPQLGAGATHGTVTYASSNPSILSVNPTTGEISAQAPGTATVTATWSGDETYCSVSSTSNVITVKGSFSVIYHANGGIGTMANQKADEDNNIAQLNANQFTRTGYAFVGWNTTAGGTGIAYADQATDITLTGNLTLYAQWAAIVTLNDAGNEETAHPTAVNGTITLPDGANACEPYEFVGWTTVATGDWNEGINEPTLVPSPYSPTEPTTLYAVYKIQSTGNSNAFKLSFEVSGTTFYVGSINSDPYIKGFSNITADNAVTFYKEKIENNTEKYWVYFEKYDSYYDETTKEYLYLYNGNDINTTNSPSETQGWILVTLPNGLVQFKDITYDKYFSFTDGGNLTDHSAGSQKSFNLLPAVSSTYYAIPDCDVEIKITFETGNGDFVANTPKTNPLVVTPGETITLPTCDYPSDGIEFIGWLKNTPQEELSDIIAEVYYEGGEEYPVEDTRDVIFYAYYKVTPEEVEFTGQDDAELKIYHYNGVDNHYYANTFAGEHAELAGIERCYDATTWKFTNIGNMQYYIQDETGKYLGAVSDSDNDFSLSNTPKVWNFTLIDGLWRMICEDSPSRALMYISTGKDFVNAALTNISNSAYSYVTLGICPDDGYTTNPVLSQGFSITNTAMVTSASGQKVKATTALTLETRNIELPCTFTIAAPNITFYDNTGAEVTQLTASAASEQFELHFAYKPTAENTIEYPTVTITDDEMKTYTIKNRIYARSLPATFVIAAKVGNLWYALPSQGLNSTTPPAAYPVEVDDMADPTTVTAVPENADWSLRGVYEASRSDATKDRYVANGDNLVFANNASPAMMLNASSSEKENYLLTDAQYNNYYSTNPGLYEWTPTTTDLETYQLTNEQRSRNLSVNTATVFGVHAQDKAVEQVRFLPITGRYTPAALQVVEWKENSVVIMYNGNPAQTASVSVNGGEAQTTTLSAAPAQRDIAVYELKATGLAANPTQRLSITIGTDKVILPIPYIISGAQTDLALLPGSTVAARQEVAKVADLVVLKDAKLTAAGAMGNPYKFRNATIYGGGKLVIPSDKGFGVASLTLRAGGITDAGKYDYVYPQFELRGTFTNSAAKINYDYITDYDHWFHLVLPFSGDLGTIKYPTEFYGANVATNNKGSWQIKRYAGEIRATGNYNAWVDIETESKTSTIAGQGYIFWGAPKKVSVNGGASTRQKWGIQRITMSVTGPNVMTAENGDKAISELSSHANVPNNSGKDNDQGWNLVGNPYMVNLTNMATTGLHACKLVEVIDPATGKWNGKWEWNNEINIRYLTIPSDHFDTYTAKTVAETVPLVAGRAFFVQLEGEADGITFATANRASLMPALLAENNDKPVDIETGIILSNETLQDEMNFWIKDGKTNDYEYNADYPKTPNNNHFNIYGVHTNGDLSWVATSPEYAAQSMPIGYQVPAAGTFTLSLSETYYSENLQALFVTDHEASPEVTTNLVDEDYTFYVNQAETNNTRFSVSIILKPEKENTPTGVDNINTKANQPVKFLYQDKIYILRNGMIYDTTGKQVITINK